MFLDHSSRGALEAEIAGAVTKFHREQQGRGPQEVRAFIVGEMVLVRCSGIFALTKSKLCASKDGRPIQSTRHELRSIHEREIEEIVGIAGIDRLMQHSVLAMPGKAVERTKPSNGQSRRTDKAVERTKPSKRRAM